MAKLSGPMAASLFEIVNGQTVTAKPNTLKALETRGLVSPATNGSGYLVTSEGQTAYVAVYGPLPGSPEDPIVSVRMNRKDRRDAGRAQRQESKRQAKARDQRIKKWGTV